MLPIAHRLEKIGLNRALSILICILLIFVFLAGIIFIFSYQIVGFAENFSSMKGVFLKKVDLMQNFIESTLHIPAEKQIALLKARVSGMSDSAEVFARNFVMATTGTISTIVLVFFYIFFFMYYREKFKNFIFKIIPKENHLKTHAVIEETSRLTQQYISGVSIVILILSILNSIGLLIVGIDNAIFFGCIASILTIIPYVGILIGSLVPILFTLLTKDSSMAALGVAGVFAFNQFIEGNFLTPNIVGSKIKINPLAAIIALVAGGFLWGIAGMILFIPFLGIVKIVFDKIEPLQPYAYLISADENFQDEPIIEKIKKRFIKKKVNKDIPPPQQ